MRLLIAGLLCGLIEARAPASDAIDSTPQAGLLVLTNGSILEGVISLEGKRYRVMLPKGELQVRATQVDFFCKSLEEAYIKRRERILANSANAHIELAQWCVQHGMLEHGMEEIALARSLDSRHRLLDVLTRQIEQLRRLATEPPAPEPTHTTTKVESTPTETMSESATNPITPVHEISKWARVEFVRRIQPMLIHTCATGGCHNPDTSLKMRLDREALAGIGDPDLIQQNLKSVVRVIDFVDPEASLLLTRGLAVHGVNKHEQSEPFTSRQMAILKAWTAQLTQHDQEDPEDPHETSVAKDAGTNFGSSAQLGQHDDDSSRHRARDPFDPAHFNDQTAEPPGDLPSATPLPPESAHPAHPLDRPTVAIP